MKMPSIQASYRNISLKHQKQLKGIIKYALELKTFFFLAEIRFKMG